MKKQIFLIVTIVTVPIIAAVAIFVAKWYESRVINEYTVQAELIYDSIDRERIKERLYRIERLAVLKSHGVTSLEIHPGQESTYTTLDGHLFTYNNTEISIVINITTFQERIAGSRILIAIVGLGLCALIIGIQYVLYTVHLVIPIHKVINDVVSVIPEQNPRKGKNEIEKLRLYIQAMLARIQNYFGRLDSSIGIITHTNTPLMADFQKTSGSLSSTLSSCKSMDMRLQELIPIIEYVGENITLATELLPNVKNELGMLNDIGEKERSIWEACKHSLEDIDRHICTQVELCSKLSEVLNKLRVSKQKIVQGNSNIPHIIKPCLFTVDRLYKTVQEINMQAMNTIIGISQGSKKGNDIISIAENIRDATAKVLNDVESTSNTLKKINSIGMEANELDNNTIHLFNEFYTIFISSFKNSNSLSAAFDKYIHSYREHVQNERNILKCGKDMEQHVNKIAEVHSRVKKSVHYSIAYTKEFEKRLNGISEKVYHMREFSRISNDRVSIVDEQVKNIITDSNAIWSSINIGSSIENRLQSINNYINILTQESMHPDTVEPVESDEQGLELIESNAANDDSKVNTHASGKTNGLPKENKLV